MQQTQEDLVRAEIDLLRAQTISTLAGATSILDSVNAGPQVARILKVIDTLTNVSEEKPVDPQCATAPASDGVRDLMDDLPPEVRELVRQFNELGMDIEVQRFPKV